MFNFDVPVHLIPGVVSGRINVPMPVRVNDPVYETDSETSFDEGDDALSIGTAPDRLQHTLTEKENFEEDNRSIVSAPEWLTDELLEDDSLLTERQPLIIPQVEPPVRQIDEESELASLDDNASVVSAPARMETTPDFEVLLEQQEDLLNQTLAISEQLAPVYEKASTIWYHMLKQNCSLSHINVLSPRV